MTVEPFERRMTFISTHTHVNYNNADGSSKAANSNAIDLYTNVQPQQDDLAA